MICSSPEMEKDKNKMSLEHLLDQKGRKCSKIDGLLKETEKPASGVTSNQIWDSLRTNKNKEPLNNKLNTTGTHGSH